MSIPIWEKCWNYVKSNGDPITSDISFIRSISFIVYVCVCCGGASSFFFYRIDDFCWFPATDSAVNTIQLMENETNFKAHTFISNTNTEKSYNRIKPRQKWKEKHSQCSTIRRKTSKEKREILLMSIPLMYDILGWSAISFSPPSFALFICVSCSRTFNAS